MPEPSVPFLLGFIIGAQIVHTFVLAWIASEVYRA